MTKILILVFRQHDDSMIKLRKILTESSKIRRRRRIYLNIHITIIAWLGEFLGGLFAVLMIFLPHENGITRGLHLVNLALFATVVPCVYLMNSSDVKSAILDNKIYLTIVNRFSPRINQIVPANINSEDLENPNG